MRYAIGLLLLCGCTEPICFEVVSPAMFTVSVEEIKTKQDETIAVLKENTNALAAIKSQVESLNGSGGSSQAGDTPKASLVSPSPNPEEVIKSAVDPQEAPRANQSQPAIPVASPPAVRLFVTNAPFHCPPCIRLEQAINAGEFDGFTVTKTGDFVGLRSYPAIRFKSRKTKSGWGVIYGYDGQTLLKLRQIAEPD